jgi:hypothetical protein
VSYIPGTPYIGANAPEKKGRGAATAASSSRGTRRPGKKVWGIQEPFRSGAARSRRRAAWCSTARSTAGSRRWTRAPARSSGSSRSARGSLVIRCTYLGPEANSTSRCTPGIGGDMGLLIAGDCGREPAVRRAGAGSTLPDLGGGRAGGACCSCSRCNGTENGNRERSGIGNREGMNTRRSRVMRSSHRSVHDLRARGRRLRRAPRRRLAPNAKRATRSVRRAPEHIPPGFPSHDRPLALVNPLEGNANAKKIGSQLYVSYNCIDCHGADGSGAMGPSLGDGSLALRRQRRSCSSRSTRGARTACRVGRPHRERSDLVARDVRPVLSPARDVAPRTSLARRWSEPAT